MKAIRYLYQAICLIPKGWNRLVVAPLKKGAFAQCGKHVTVNPKSVFSGIGNIFVSDYVVIGEANRFLTTRAQIVIGDHVLFGPNVTIVTGNHRIDMCDRFIFDATDEYKMPENDQDVIFEGDNWIGTNATILKGVTVGRGAVIAAGAVVTKNVAPYTIAAGVPAKFLANRFTDQQVQQYEKNIMSRKG